MSVTVYTFETSQPLTAKQLEFLNKAVSLLSLPTEDPEDMLDIPEWTTDITGPTV